MPIHDWTTAPSGVVHDFNIGWAVELQKALNKGLLPDGCYAMVEPAHAMRDRGLQGSAEALNESKALEARRRRIVVRSAGDQPLAIVEIVSSMLKRDSESMELFTTEAMDCLRGGIALLLLDLFPPGSFDPEGIHGRLWGSLGGHHAQPEGKPLTLASYAAGGGDALTECYVEPTAVGQALFAMPLFLTTARYVNVPLEETYLAAYAGMPARWKRVIEEGPRG